MYLYVLLTRFQIYDVDTRYHNIPVKVPSFSNLYFLIFCWKMFW